MIAISARASASAVSSNRRGATVPSANAWLTATRPCRPEAIVRSAMSRSSAAPVSPKSCKWMSIPLPNASARPNTMSSWPLTSPSKPAGSRPPTRSAPAMRAAASRSGAPGLRRHAALRESDELDVDPITKGLANPDDRFEIVEADIVVDVDVAARPRGAVHDQRTDERRRAGFDRQGDPMALDALGAMRSRTLRPSTWGRRGALKWVLSRWTWPSTKACRRSNPSRSMRSSSRRRGPRRVHSDDEAARDFHVGETPLGQARVGQDHQMRFSRFAAAYW